MRRQTDPVPGHPPLKAASRPRPRRFFFFTAVVPAARRASGVFCPGLTLCRLGIVLPFVSWALLGLVVVRPSSLALFRPGSVLGVRFCVRPGRLLGLARLWRRPPSAVHGLRPQRMGSKQNSAQFGSKAPLLQGASPNQIPILYNAPRPAPWRVQTRETGTQESRQNSVPLRVHCAGLRPKRPRPLCGLSPFAPPRCGHW